MHRDYELLRAALAGSGAVDAGLRMEQAEVLVLGAYARFLEHGGAPPRPLAAVGEADGPFGAYARAFGGAAMRALERTTSADFQLIAKAHVLGLAQSESFPELRVKQARALYSNAISFGHALRQAETRFQADRVAGTFVPVATELEVLREELEDLFAQSPSEESDAKATSAPSAALAASTAVGTIVRAAAEAAAEAAAAGRVEEPEASDGGGESANEAAQRGLREVLARLRRLGEVPPGFATYLGWLGRADPEAMSLLATPRPSVALAMQLQVTAVWGDPTELDAADTVSTTPFDMIEAMLFGAWLRDAAVAAEEATVRHQEPEADGGSREDEEGGCEEA